MAALTVLSYGIYVPLWFGFSWAELRRDSADDTMQPAAHGASIFIPGYGTWQAYRHFALIGQLLTRVGSPLKVEPSTAALATTVWSCRAAAVPRIAPASVAAARRSAENRRRS